MLPIERLSLVLLVPEDEVDGLIVMGRAEVTRQWRPLPLHRPHQAGVERWNIFVLVGDVLNWNFIFHYISSDNPLPATLDLHWLEIPEL